MEIRFPHVAVFGIIGLLLGWYLTFAYGQDDADVVLKTSGPVLMIFASSALASMNSWTHQIILIVQSLATIAYGCYAIYKFTADQTNPFSGWNAWLKIEGPLVVFIGLLDLFSNTMKVRSYINKVWMSL